MADNQKILSLKLSVDVTEGTKLEKVFEGQKKSLQDTKALQDTIVGLEQARATALGKNVEAQKLLETKLITANALIEKQGSNVGLAVYNMERSIGVAERVRQEQAAIVKELDRQLAMYKNIAEYQQKAPVGQAGVDNRGYVPNASGTVAENRAKALAEAQVKAGEDAARAIKAQEEARLINTRSIADQILRETDKETLSRVAMYRKMFDTITAEESKRKAAYLGAVQGNAASQTTVKAPVGFNYATGNTAIASNTAVVNTNTAAQKANATAVAEVTIAHKNLFIRIGEIISIYRLYTTAIQLTEQALKAIPKAGLEQQATQASLFGIFGTEEGLNNIKFIHDVAMNAGQSLTTLEQAYRRYAPSAILAGAQQKEVNKSFKEFAEVGTILHLPEEKINSLFLALDQMYAKGVVQSEEVKKQLGNVLPGAVETFAIAMGKTPAAFMAAMKANEVIAKDAVPKFAEYYRKIFGGPDDSVFNLVKDRLQSNLYRLETVYTDLNRKIFQDTQVTMNNIVKASVSMVERITENLEAIKQSVEILSSFIILRLAGAAFTGIVTNFALLATKVSAFTTVVTGMSAPIVAATAAFASMYLKLNDLSLGYDKAVGFTIKFKDSQVSLTNYLESVVEVALKNIVNMYDRLTNAFGKLTIQGTNGETLWRGLLPGSVLLDNLKLVETGIYKIVAALSTLKDVGIRNLGTDDALTKYKKTLEELQNFSPIIDPALKKGTEDILAQLNGKQYDDVLEAIASGQLKATNDIVTALKGIGKPIPATAISGTGLDGNETTLVGETSNKRLSDAITKENNLLKQSIDNINNTANLRKIAIENTLKNLDFNQANPQLGKAETLSAYDSKRLALVKELNAIEQHVTQETLKQTLHTKENITQLERELDLSKARSTEIIRAIRLQESGSRDRTEKSDRAAAGSKADPSYGAMQVTKAAWMATGRAEIEFNKEKYEELDKAGQEYFKKQVDRFKDLRVALAAYNQGPGAVAKVYADVGVKIGDIDEEELKKVYAKFTPLMKKYSSEVIAKLPADKVGNEIISKQTEVYSLRQQQAEQQLQAQQKITEEQQKQTVNLQAYKTALRELEATALESQGKIVEAGQIRIALKNEELALQYKDNAEALKYVEIIKKQALVQNSLIPIQQNIAKIHTLNQEQYNDAINKTNILVQTGVITQLDAAFQLTAANEAKIASMEKELQLEKEVMAAMANAPTTQQDEQAAKIRTMTTELENLKLTANEVAQYFNTQFGEAFDNAFGSFLSGTQSAKDAFKGFAQSVIDDIGKIIAKEIRLKAVQGILSVIQGLAGATSGGSAANLTSDGVKYISAAVDGAAVSGISSASGTVLSSPTYFPSAKVIPFATGGVLAGEAGHEAVLPLKRNAQGKLGVVSEGGNSSNITIQSLSVSVVEKEGSTSEEQAQLIASMIRTQLITITNQEMTNSMRSGNMFNQTSIASAF